MGLPYNFAAGPGVLPASVLEQAADSLRGLPGLGVTPLEISHRGVWFRDTIEEAEANLRALLAIPSTYRVLFCQGGASMQFSMVPMNLLRGDRAEAHYVLTGSWGRRAFAEAAKEGSATAAWTGERWGWDRVPEPDVLAELLPADAAYTHITTNETIEGVQFPDLASIPTGSPSVADMSSDFLSRPVEIDRFGLVFAGAQKNAGPAGVAVVIIDEELLERAPDSLPTLLDYRTYAEHGSLFNTPPVFSIYVLMLVTRWLRDEIGGLEAMAARNATKASLLYGVIDEQPDVYWGHAQIGSRSTMNVVFRLPTPELDAQFLQEAAAEGLVELRGHRSVGGIRASIYNAMPLEGARALAAFMRSFAGRRA